MENVVILSCVRTPIGAYGGAMKDIPVYRLGSLVLNEAVKRAGIEAAAVDDVIMGTSYQNGECANGSRMAILDAGWPDTVPGVVIDRRCCSGVESVFYGALQIQTGNAEIIVAGGMDSMSQAEVYIPGDIKWGLGGKSHEKYGYMPRGHGALAMWGIPLYDRIQRGRVMSQPIHRYGELNSMMSWAEIAAKKENITREEADRWAYHSHQKAIAAWDAGKFANEIVAVPVGKGKSGDIIFFHTDEGPRRETTMEKLARLRPVYPDGVCTAGNSSSENDGASVVVLASERKTNRTRYQTNGILPVVRHCRHGSDIDVPGGTCLRCQGSQEGGFEYRSDGSHRGAGGLCSPGIGRRKALRAQRERHRRKGECEWIGYLTRPSGRRNRHDETYNAAP